MKLLVLKVVAIAVIFVIWATAMVFFGWPLLDYIINYWFEQ